MAERKDVYQPAGMARADVGSARVAPESIRLGEPTSLTIEYAAGEAGIRKGGRISVFVPYGWTPPQDDDPAGAGAISLSASRPGVNLKFRTHTWLPGKFNQAWGAESSRFRNFWVIVSGRDLEPGDTVRIVWGDRSAGGPGIWPSPLEVTIELPVCVWTGDGPSMFFFTETAPKLTVRGGPAARLAVAVPSVLRPGESGDLHVSGRDGYGEISSGPTEPLTWGDAPPAAMPEDRNVLRLAGAIRFERDGVHRVAARAGALGGTSNPVEVRPDGPRLFWGDPHVHTALSDGLGTMDEAYEYARESAALDFAALADHMDAASDGPERFRQLQQAAERFNRPGEFVTLPGFEGTRAPGQGDVNLYFLHEDAPMLWRAEGYENPRDVYAAFEPDDILAVPHSHIGVNWDQVDTRYCRLYEVYSVWGNSEYFGCPRMNVGARDPAHFLRHGLGLGLRLGIIAGGDDHAGHSGNSRWLRTAVSYPNGLTAVYADELTREALFGALRARRAYATTGARIILHFSVNGLDMGGEGPAADRRTLRADVHGTDAVKAVTVVRNGREVHEIRPGAADVSLEWEDDEPFGAASARGERCPTPFIYYYVRVTQADGQMAWSSPVWFSDG